MPAWNQPDCSSDFTEESEWYHLLATDYVELLLAHAGCYDVLGERVRRQLEELQEEEQLQALGRAQAHRAAQTRGSVFVAPLPCQVYTPEALMLEVPP